MSTAVNTEFYYQHDLPPKWPDPTEGAPLPGTSNDTLVPELKNKTLNNVHKSLQELEPG